MSESKSRFFRFHLLTAVLMMVVVGATLGANVAEQTMPSIKSDPTFITIRYCGWPFTYRLRFHLRNDAEWDGTKLSRFWGDVSPMGNNIFEKLRVGHLFLNIIAGGSLVALTALTSEFLIRRREGRKP